MPTLTPSLVMKFDSPATKWVEALPLGNGKLGLMAHGGVEVEHLQVNDGTAWSGTNLSQFVGPRISAEGAAAAIAAARQAIREERFDDAKRELQKLQNRHSQAYLPFVDVRISSLIPGGGEATEYSRSLDLSTATHLVSYRVDGHLVTRETFVSKPHGVAVVSISTVHPAGLAVGIDVTTALRLLESRLDAESAQLIVKLPSNVSPKVDQFEHPVTYSDDDSESMQGAIALRWTHDGLATGDVAATGVHHATIVFSTETTFAGIGRAPEGDGAAAAARAESTVAHALADGPDAVRADQRADHAALFDRAELVVGTGVHDQVSLGDRLRLGNESPLGPLGFDPGLAALAWNFGRYLLIGSSREGAIPANLQGIWNDQLQAPWSGNYTTNINVEMNYWPAEVANLSELATPLFDLIDTLAVTGVETATRLYDAPGWVAHHNSDPWGYSQPVGYGKHDPRWAFWPMAGAWLARHLWEHLLFGADDEFARTRAWGPIRSASEFYLHWLIEMPDGSLGTSPSSSPENVFTTPEGTPGSVDESSTLDLVLIADLFRMLEALAARLGISGDPVVERAASARRRIPGPVVGRDGRIPEWRADRPQYELDHRHVSHLYFAFPGDLALTPELAAGVSASLDGRGDEATGWSVAWKVALRARLSQPNKVSDVLRLVFRDMSVDRGAWIGGLYPNLLVAHPPFQIDGNLGYVAGIVECLVQSHRGEIELLPAVPTELSTGRVRGIIARPGVEVSLEWAPDETGQVAPVSATFTAIRESAVGRHRIVWRDLAVDIDLRLHVPSTIVASGFIVVQDR